MNENNLMNPFDPASLRLDQNFAQESGVKKLLNTVPVRKPNKQEFVRVHPEHCAVGVGIIELKEDRETYLVTPAAAQAHSNEVTIVTIYTAISRQGVVFLWPVKTPLAETNRGDWARSAAIAAEQAKKKWVRVQANMNLGAYDVWEATANLPAPDWPDLTFEEILKIGFKDRLIDGPDHPVFSRLLGKE
jgi:hypothetical protein